MLIHFFSRLKAETDLTVNSTVTKKTAPLPPAETEAQPLHQLVKQAKIRRK